MDVRSVAVRLSAEVSGYVAGMRQAGAETKKALGDATKHAADHDQALNQLGNTSGKVALAATAGLAAIVGATARFDKAMSGVKATGDDAAESYDQLREAAVQAGADTAFSATEAAEGIENLAKAGVSAEDVLGGGLSGALDLAAAGQLDVASAAEAAAGAMAQFKLEGEDVPHIADLLAAGAGKAQGEVSDMVMALKQAGTVSAQTGLSIEETVGALSAMAEQSLLGSDAGTSFKTMLAALTPNSEKAASAMEQYNIHAFDAQGNFVGMTELAGQLREGLGGLTDEQRAMTLETIFGSDAVRAASIIFDNGAEGIAKWTDEVNDAGFAAETAATKMDNLAGDWEEFTGSLETALIGSGEGSTGVLRALVQGATDAVNVFNEMPPAVQNTATAMLAVTAITGGGLWFGSKVIQGVSDTSAALKNLGVTGPRAKSALKGVGVAGAGLAAVMVGFYAIDKLNQALDETLPSAEALQGRLIDLAETGTASALGAEFDSLEESVARIADGRWDDGLSSFFDALLPGDTRAASLREATAEVEALDSQLASLVNSGHAEVAAEALDALTEGMSPERAEQFVELLTGYDSALAGAANEAALSATASDAAADGFADVEEAAEDATVAVEDFTNAIDALFGAAIDQDEALTQWRSGIRTLTKELKGGSDALNVNTKRGQENRDAIRSRVDDLLSSVKADAEAGVAQDVLARKLRKGREEILAAGEAANISKGQMREYLRELDLTPRQIRTLIEAAGVDEARAKVENLNAALREAARDREARITVTTHYNDVYGRDPYGGVRREASGGPIIGPGTTTSDSILVAASTQEHMWSAAEVQGAGGHGKVEQLRRLARSGELTVIGGYAEGGQIRANPVATPRFSPVVAAAPARMGPSGPMEIRGVVDIPALAITAPMHGVVSAENRADRAYSKAMGESR